MLYWPIRCDYVEEDCPFGCGQRLPRLSLKAHTTLKCTKRPIEVQLQCLSREMMDKLTTLETKYEEKVVKLEEKIKEQEEKLVKQEEHFQQEIKRLSDDLSRALEERVTQVVNGRSVGLKERLKMLGDAGTSVENQCRDLKDRVCFQTEISIDKSVFKYIRTLESWRRAEGKLKTAGGRMVVSEDSVQLEHGVNSKEKVEGGKQQCHVPDFIHSKTCGFVSS